MASRWIPCGPFINESERLATERLVAKLRGQSQPWILLLDSFQEAEGYPGELYYFSLVDTGAVTLATRAADAAWSFADRLAFTMETLRALHGFHEPADHEPRLTHRNLHPWSLRVRHNNRPLFTDFRLGRLEGAATISARAIDFGERAPFVAPEVLNAGLAVASRQSDVYSVCRTLATLFTTDSPDGVKILEILEQGCGADLGARAELTQLIAALEAVPLPPSSGMADADESATVTPPLVAYWDEDTEVPFLDSTYKVLTRLGRGGIGQAFKVVEIDPEKNEKFGTYVAKAVSHQADGQATIRAYKHARSHSIHPHLATIHAIAADWRADRFVALLNWVEGQPLEALFGVLGLYAADWGVAAGETSDDARAEHLARRWLAQLCEGLQAFHQVHLVHGDVSPRNILVQDDRVILTDYDTVAPCGEPARGGTLHYCSPEVQQRQAVQPSDDVFALAASFFHLLTDRLPFVHDEELRKDLGLNWGEDAGRFPQLHAFFARATAAQRSARFAHAQEALQMLQRPTSPLPAPTPTLAEQQVPWLRDLLSAYPGSRYGNQETRGLDSDFALATYVETCLDQRLYEDVAQGAVNLVILFGNAGDGKTALLQHLAYQLSGARIPSSQRVWTQQLPNGQHIKINLDGSASWNGQGADALLDALFAPFQQPDYPQDRTHIVAINSGKLLEWLDAQTEETYLTEQLREALLEDTPPQDPRLRLIDLNQRSLVGGFNAQAGTLSSGFFDTLVERLLGGADQDPWAVCPRCTAQARCTAWATVQLWRDPEAGARFKTRLLDALQACHQRGEIHITARELRAALSYILFGLDACADRHAQPDKPLEPAAARVFDPRSPGRQGELLRELTRLDPALDADPVLDRDLLASVADSTTPEALAQARRGAYFSRPDGAVRLVDGQHYARFRAAVGLDAAGRATLCRDLCDGIARLEPLPRGAKPPDHGLPLRVTPRTPTESALCVVKLQRLAQEDFRELYAWHPAEDERVWRLRIVEKAGRQQLVREALNAPSR